MQIDTDNNLVMVEGAPQAMSHIVLMVCFYMFLYIERPWETISYLQGFQIERWYAVLMLIIAFLSRKLIITRSPTNKWVYGLLLIHFMLAPFAFSSEFAVDQGIEYGKMVVLYLLLLAIADREAILKVLLRAYLLSTIIYSLHSLKEYFNGRHQIRMSISRMVGADWADPNAFGATLILSLPIAYVFVRFEKNKWICLLYYVYFFVIVQCVILTGSRSSFVALVLIFLIWSLLQKGGRKFVILAATLVSMAVVWNVMPEEKQTRIRSLWDEDAGPANAHESAEGRKDGFRVSWRMFKREPWTGVGGGGQNFIGYRLANKIDEDGKESATQAHIVYGQVLAEFGIGGAFLFIGLIVSIIRCCLVAKRYLIPDTFLYSLGGAMLMCLFLLLFTGLGGHNFYRPFWLWLAAWSGSLLTLATQHRHDQPHKPLC